MGRESQLTPEVTTSILDALSAGVTYEIAAGRAGIDDKTFHRWMELGKADHDCVPLDDPQHRPGRCDAKPPHEPGTCPNLAVYRDFREAVTRRLKDVEVKLAAEMTTQARRDWRAAWAILRARFPERWTPLTRAEISGPGGGPIEVAPARDRLRARVEQLAKSGRLHALPARANGDETDDPDHEEETG